MSIHLDWKSALAKSLIYFLCSMPSLLYAADNAFKYGGAPRDYGMDLVVNHNRGALSVKVIGKKVHPAQADANGVAIISDNKILQFSVMRIGSISGKSVSDSDSERILETHQHSRVEFLKTISDAPIVSNKGKFEKIRELTFYYWHVDTPPLKDSKNAPWRHLHATTAVDDLIVIFIVPLTRFDDESTMRSWLSKTAETLTVHDKPFVSN